MHYSADSEASNDLGNVLLEILHNLYGKDAVIDISRDSALTPEQSGKFQLACAIKDLYPEGLF
jgi:hypothetical protein